MYIGAWAEYRLALQQQQQRGGKNNNNDDGNAAQSNAPGNQCTSRQGAGIYHPSLPEKGGTEVASLPNREIFRKTLESALSSNLAADDAEQIAQALEPLLQRLPTIRRAHGGPTTHCRFRRRNHCRDGRNGSRRTTRCNLRRGCTTSTNTFHSEGTRSARLPSSDGTWSARSGFSSASAPTTTGMFSFNDRGIGIANSYRGRNSNNCGTMPGTTTAVVPQLPRIVHTRAALSDMISDDGNEQKPFSTQPGRRRELVGSSHAVVDTDCTTSVTSNDNSGNDNSGKNQHGRVRHRQVACDGNKGDHVHGFPDSVEEGGFDSGRAATVLRMARNRDPAGIKADFQQFWTWKTRGDTMIDNRARRGAGAAAASGGKARDGVKRRNGDGGGVGGAKGGGRGGAGCAATLSRLEVLERMKNVYMAKCAAGDDAPSTPKHPVGGDDHGVANAFPHNRTPAQRLLSHDVGEASKHAPSAGDYRSAGASPQLYLEDNGESKAPASAGIFEAGYGCATEDAQLGEYRGQASAGDPDSALPEEPIVVVPDLELTESRIRQVDKYFGGGRRPHLVEGYSQPGPQQQQHDTVLKPACLPPSSNNTMATPTAPETSSAASNGGVAGEEVIHDESDNYNHNRAFNSGTSNTNSSIPIHNRMFKTVHNGSSSNKGDYRGGSSSPETPLNDDPSQTSAISIHHETTMSNRQNRHEKIAPEIHEETNSSRSSIDSPSSTRSHNSGKADGEFVVDAKPCSPVTPMASSGSSASFVAAPAPAWCGDSLEDLVCWTRQLDFDAAVKGY